MTAMSRILIVDDDPAAILVLYNALEGMGELCAATSGEEALGLLASHPFDLVLLDVMMPGLDGFVTCRAIRHDHPDLPVLFVTAANDIGNEIRGLGVGGNDFITKPLNPPVVRTRVGNHLKLKAQNDRLRCLSSRDPLTGLANRRALDERLSLEWRLAVRQRQPLALLLVAIDHFQAYTDTMDISRATTVCNGWPRPWPPPLHRPLLPLRQALWSPATMGRNLRYSCPTVRRRPPSRWPIGLTTRCAPWPFPMPGPKRRRR